MSRPGPVWDNQPKSPAKACGWLEEKVRSGCGSCFLMDLEGSMGCWEMFPTPLVWLRPWGRIVSRQCE